MIVRAARVTAPGRPPEVGDHELADPGAPGGPRALVEVLAAPITPLDLLCASGTSYFGVPATPYVPGVQGVGVLDGQVVWFPTAAGTAPGDGSMATHAVVARADVVALPQGADPVLVAALGLSAVAAEQALELGGLVAGEQVLVLGAGGVVGQVAVQLARHGGARRVVAGARSPGARARAQAAGTDAVVGLDTDDVAELAARFAAVGDGPVDLVVDTLFGVPAAAAARTLRPGGRLVNLGAAASETSPLDSATLRSRSLHVLGYTNSALSAEQRSASVARVAERAARGLLTAAREAVPLHRTAEAWRRQAAGAASGRLVLVP